MEIIKKLLAGDIVQYIFLGVLILNAILSALSSGLVAIGKSEKVPVWVNNLAIILKKVIDFLSANLAHKK